MHIKIGPMVFTVESTDGLRGGDDIKLAGRVQYGACKIAIEDSYCAQAQRQTLWHEIVHIVLLQNGQEEMGANEGLVEMLANAFMQVVQDNSFLAEQAE